MAGGAGVGAGLGIMGGTLGGIGDIIAATNYERPELQAPSDQERRLRRLAQNQLVAGGQQLLGGTALYNQMVPMLMGQLPGMSYVPGSSGGDASMGGVASTAGGGSSGLGSYQDALAAYQRQQTERDAFAALKAQRKGAKGKEKKALGKQVKAAKKNLKSQVPLHQLERQQYMAGVQPSPEIYDIRMGGGGAGGGAASSGQESLGAIRGMMDAMNGSGPNLQSLYQGMG